MDRELPLRLNNDLNVGSPFVPKCVSDDWLKVWVDDLWLTPLQVVLYDRR